jgi:hypothetical protein
VFSSGIDLVHGIVIDNLLRRLCLLVAFLFFYVLGLPACFPPCIPKFKVKDSRLVGFRGIARLMMVYFLHCILLEDGNKETSQICLPTKAKNETLKAYTCLA